MNTHEVIDIIARRQHGLVTRRQLLDAGFSRSAVNRRVAKTQLRPVHLGVYQVGPVTAPRAREMAAILACGGGCVSHRTGAALLTLLPLQASAEPVDVTIPPGPQRGRRPGIRAHRSALDEEDITVIDGIPVTSPARTMLDLTGCASPRELERALAIAERMRPAVRAEISALLGRVRGHSGAARLRTLMETAMTPALTRSEAEEMLLALIRSGGLPEPAMNVVLHGYEVDCFWQRPRLVVEVDGYAFHGSARAFSKDRQRDSALAAAGIQVVRLSWEQIHDQREKTLVQLAQALARAQQ